MSYINKVRNYISGIVKAINNSVLDPELQIQKEYQRTHDIKLYINNMKAIKGW